MVEINIRYGIFGGARRASRLIAGLRSAGYEITTRSDADIIFAHSAGCFWLPRTKPAQLLILVDPPYWPGRTVQERGRARMRSNLRFRSFGYPTAYWLARNAWGLYYGIRDARRTVRILKFSSRYDLSAALSGRRAILIRNRHDDWLTPHLDTLSVANPLLQLRTVPGDHDDCMYNPAPYIQVLKDYV